MCDCIFASQVSDSLALIYERIGHLASEDGVIVALGNLLFMHNVISCQVMNVF